MNLQQAIQMAKDIDQQSKAVGFNQSALDQKAQQGLANAQFEVNVGEGLDLMAEFCTNENQDTDTEHVQPVTAAKTKVKPKPNQGKGFVQVMQKGLQGSVRVVN